MGTIENQTVPRNRALKLESKVFKKYQRKEVSLTNLINGLPLAGISIRRVGEVLEDVVGYKISAQTVSNIAKELEEGQDGRLKMREPVSKRTGDLIWHTHTAKTKHQ